jgi:copper(I)-binding protein
MAAYLTAKNTGHNPATILSITSPAFNSIEIHRTTIINGIARMEPVKNLVIPPGNEVRLEPGGMHLMLFGPNRALRAGDEVKLSFTLDDGNSLSIMATVRQSTIR